MRQKYRILRCLGRPGCPKKANIFIVAGARIKKIDFRSRYVCVFVHALMAKTTIGKSMCVFVTIRVCVCVLCNPCVCLCAIRVCVCGRCFTVNYVVFWAYLKTCQGCHVRRVFTFKMPSKIRVCVFGVRPVPYLRGETQIDVSGARRKSRFGDTPETARMSSGPLFKG